MAWQQSSWCVVIACIGNTKGASTVPTSPAKSQSVFCAHNSGACKMHFRVTADDDVATLSTLCYAVARKTVIEMKQSEKT